MGLCNLIALKNMASLKGKTLRVGLKNINDLERVLNKMYLRKDIKTNEILGIEDVYFNRTIGSMLPNHYTDRDKKLAKRLYKCVVSRVYSADSVTINKKDDILKKFNWENFKVAVIDTVEAVRTYALDKKIVCADVSRIPFDNLFYNFKIKTRDTANREVLKMFKSISTFSTGSLKMGYQAGERDSNGNTVLSEFEPSSAMPDKCYFTLNFIEDIVTSTNEKKETVTIYYYLGNQYMN